MRKLGLNSPIVQNGLPSLRSPEGPMSRTAEPTPAAGHHQRLRQAVSCPEQQKRAAGATPVRLGRASRVLAALGNRRRSREWLPGLDGDEERHLEPLPVAVDVVEAELAQPRQLALDVEQAV